MTRLIPIAILQSAVLALAQVLLKFALAGFGKWQWSWQFVKSQLTNWYWLGCGVMFTGATVLWMYMLKRFPFSQAYPMSCLSYVFGMIAAIPPLPGRAKISVTAGFSFSFLIMACSRPPEPTTNSFIVFLLNGGTNAFS